MKTIKATIKNVAALSVISILMTGAVHASNNTTGERERGQHRGAANVSEVERDIQHHQWFANMDTNNDGYISEAEFVAAAVERAEAGARAAFARMDSDNTGEVSAEQFKAIAEARSERVAERREAMRERAKAWRSEAREQGRERGERKERRRPRNEQ